MDNLKRARRDLNPRHPEPESGALSTELRALTTRLSLTFLISNWQWENYYFSMSIFALWPKVQFKSQKMVFCCFLLRRYLQKDLGKDTSYSVDIKNNHKKYTIYGCTA